MESNLAIMMLMAFFIWWPRLSQATLTIEMPKGTFCELDRLESCKVDDCIRFDPNIWKTSPSLITVLAEGHVGHMISAYVTLLWIHWAHGLPIFLEKSAKSVLSQIFVGLDKMMTLEDNLCNSMEFGFQKMNVDIAEALGRPEYAIGKALVLPHNIPNPSHGWWALYRRFREKTRKTLRFHPEIGSHAERTIQAVSKKVKNGKKRELVFVGVHVRRLKNKSLESNSVEELEEDYYVDAMEYFRDEYGDKKTVFLFVGDDMKWARRNRVLKEEKNVSFVGCGEPGNHSCIGKDLAVLAKCNHTIESRGSLGQWASYLAGGDVYTEYGPVIREAYGS